MKIEKSIWIDAAPTVVRTFFLDSEKLIAWSGVAARLDPKAGGIYELDMGQAGVLQGRFVTVEENLIIQDIDLPDGTGVSRICIELSEEAGGTRVKIHQDGLAAPFDSIASRGWDHHLARLSVAVHGDILKPDTLAQKPMSSLLDI